MRLPYQFNEKYDPKDQDWGFTAPQVISHLTFYKKKPYSVFSERRPIEEQIEFLANALGGLAEALISKGRLTPQEFLDALDDETYEVRQRNQK